MLRISTVVATKGVRCFSTLTGTVKFYNHGKAFGFVVPDDKSVGADVFLHRANIATTFVAEELPFGLPFLRAAERIQFELETDGDGKLVARNIMFEDGSHVPVYRPIHVSNMQTSQKKKFGVYAYDILDDEAMSESEKVTRIMEEYAKAKELIQELEAKKDAEHAKEAGGAVVVESPEDVV